MGSWNATFAERSPLWLGPQRRPLATSWVPVMFVLAAIAAESTRTAGTATTEHLLLACTHRMHYATTLRDVVTPNWQLRKLGHFVGYGMLGLLITRGWLQSMYPRKPAFVHAAAIGTLCAAMIASLDEWHQSFLPGRCSSIHDVALDTVGALTCILLYLAVSVGHRRQA